MPNRRILLVEDHDGIRKGLVLLLERLGYEVTSAGSVADGIHQADGHDVALIDLRLPDGSGVNVLRHLRESRSPARVALFTAGVTANVLETAAPFTPDQFFEKPFNVDALLKWIADAAEKKSPF